MAPNHTVSLAFGIAGSITSSLMYCSPVHALYKARIAGSLGVSAPERVRHRRAVLPAFDRAAAPRQAAPPARPAPPRC